MPVLQRRKLVSDGADQFLALGKRCGVLRAAPVTAVAFVIGLPECIARCFLLVSAHLLLPAVLSYGLMFRL
jgi:hypothetical protein